MTREKYGDALREEDWGVIKDKELETMFQGLAVSVDEYTGNDSDASMDKNVYTYKVLSMTMTELTMHEELL
ncbi:hypothetical protein KIN20_004299 [Parelaphostrongylus tenuis]|uniref:Uncharacterized protein n=1 Tax=Parelaphostrongylus tenuis TaxID=148309 RepID=A0AAD5QGT0_PARTN|nr:hypothetical protein KIN20_004299 [Parelaphostrongylus tenuis]